MAADERRPGATDDGSARAWLDAFYAEGGTLHLWSGSVWFGRSLHPVTEPMNALMAKMTGGLRGRVVALAKVELGGEVE